MAAVRGYFAIGDKRANDCFHLGEMEPSVVKKLPSSQSAASSHAKTTFGVAIHPSKLGCDTALPRYVQPEDRRATKRPGREPDVAGSH